MRLDDEEDHDVSQPLSPDALKEMMTLVRGADSVELKLTIPETDRYATLASLDVDPLDARIRQIFFFDTPDLALDAAGVVVRARRIQDAAADTTVKLRPVVPDELEPELREDASFGVEVDAMPGGFVCSGSMKATTTNEKVQRIVKGSGPLRKLFSKPQRALFKTHAPDGLTLDDLTMLGPVPVLKLKLKPKSFGRKLALELWNYPDGSRILEISTKCPPAEALAVANEARAYLAGRGIDLWGEQSTKTKTALTYFAANARGEG
jgi:hypothetical protein